MQRARAGFVRVKSRRPVPEKKQDIERAPPENRPAPVAVMRKNGERKKLFTRTRIHSAVTTPGNYECLNNIFAGRDLYIVGSGGSLYGFRFDRLRELQKAGAAVMAINNSIMDVPFADVMFSCDLATKKSASWNDELFKGVRDWSNTSFHLVCTWADTSPGDNITVCNRTNNYDVRPNKDLYATHSGVGSLHVGIWSGAGRIFLLGHDCARFHRSHVKAWAESVIGSEWYDQNAVEDAIEYLQADNDRYLVHYFSRERPHKRDKPKGAYVSFHNAYGMFKRHADRIYNCSPISSIQYFKFIRL